MSKKTISIILLIVGIIGLAISLLSDVIGLGDNNDKFGLFQLIGTIASGIVALVGLFLLVKN